MKKHIFGLLIFGFIVSAAAIVYAVFNVPEIVSVSVPQYAPAERKYCNLKREVEELQTGSPLIKQATLSSGSGLFVFEIGCVESPKRMSLYFYEKNENDTQLIATEEIDLKPVVNCETNSSLYKNFNWAKEINPASNIYVVARISDKGQKFSTNFNESLAVPVLMASSNKLVID